jgi:hypothetical protein
MSRKLIVISILTMLCMVFVASSVQAELNLADGAASGQWYNPARDGEGFYVLLLCAFRPAIPLCSV